MTMGMDIENTVIYQAFALLLAFCSSSPLLQLVFPRAIFRDALLPRFGTAGQPFHYRVAGEKSDGQNADRPDLLEESGRSAAAFREWLAIATGRRADRSARSASASARAVNPFRSGDGERGRSSADAAARRKSRCAWN